MATLHGAPLPEDFTDGNPLTAAEFNAVKNYWVTNELPEEGPNGEALVDGDVVFVIGDSPVSGADLVGGVAGWAAITEVSGTADLTTLQNDGIAPTDAKEDSEVTGTYNYTDNEGVEWRVAVFTDTNDTHSITTSDGLVETLIIGGGGSGGGATDGMGGGPGCGGAGAYLHDIRQLSGTTSVTVGAGGFANSSARSCEDGKNSVLGKVVAPGGGRGALTNSTTSTLNPAASGGGGAYVNNSGNNNGSGVSQGLGNDGGGVWSGSRGGGGGGAATSAGAEGQGGDGFIDSITGNSVGYAGGGWFSDAGVPPVDFGAGHSTYGNSGKAGSGSGGTSQGSGGSGIVVVRSPKDATQSWEPAPELPGIGGWATIEEVTGNPTRYEYPAENPEWVAFEWGTAGDFTCKTTAGIMDALIVSGGGAGSSATGHSAFGTCGRVNEGLITVTGDDHIVKVGAGGRWATLNGRSYPSSFASHVATFVGYGQPTYGSAAVDPTIDITLDGMKSSITGTEQEYAPGNYSTQTHGHVYGQPGRDTGRDGFNGVVIVRVPVAYDNTKGQGSTPASVVAAVEQAKETAKETIKRNRRNR